MKIATKKYCIGCLLFFVCLFCLIATPKPTAYAEPITDFSGGTGEAETPYLLSSADDILDLSQKVNDGSYNADGKLYASCHYALTQSVDMSEKNFTPIGSGTSTYIVHPDMYAYLKDFYDYFESVNPNGFYEGYWDTYHTAFYTDSACTVPCDGTFDTTGATRYYYPYETINGFYGSLDGQGYSVVNLSYISSTAPYGGFFGYIRNATIKNLSIRNAYITCSASESKVGAFAGCATGSVITGTVTNDSYTYCKASSCTLSGTYAGGIVGYFEKQTILTADTNGYNMLSSDACIEVLNEYQLSVLSICAAENNTVTGKKAAGGILAWNALNAWDEHAGNNLGAPDYLSIQHSYAYQKDSLTTITATDTVGFAADIVAYSEGKNCSVTNCLTQAPVSATYYGGITAGIPSGDYQISAFSCFSTLQSNPLFSNGGIPSSGSSGFYENVAALSGNVSLLVGEKTSTFKLLTMSALPDTDWLIPQKSGTTYYYPVLKGSNLLLGFTGYDFYVNGVLENIFYKGATYTYTFIDCAPKTGYTPSGWKVDSESSLYAKGQTKQFTFNQNHSVTARYTLKNPTLNVAALSFTFDGKTHNVQATATHDIPVSATFVWKKNDVIVSTTSVLSVRHVDDAGSYTCTVTVEDTNEQTASTQKTVSVSISPVTLLIDLHQTSTYEYGTVPTQATCSPTTLASGETFSVCYIVGANTVTAEPTEIGQYMVSACPDNDTVRKNDYFVTALSREIVGKKIILTVTLPQNEVTYTGVPVTPTNTVSYPDVALDFGEIPTAVGSYTIHATLTGSKKDCYELLETPASLTISAATFTATPKIGGHITEEDSVLYATYTFDTTEHKLLTSDFTLQGVQNAQAVSLTVEGVTDATDRKTVSYTLSAPNHNDVKGSVTYVVEKASVTLTSYKPITVKTKYYDGTSYYPVENWAGCFEESLFTLSSSVFKKDDAESVYGNDLTIEGTFSLRDDKNYCIDGENTLSYEGGSIVDMPLTFTSKTYTFRKIYDGQTINTVNVPDACYTITTATGNTLSVLRTTEDIPVSTFQGTVVYGTSDASDDCTASVTFTVDLTNTHYTFETIGKSKTITLYDYAAQIAKREVTLSGVEALSRTADGTTVVTLKGGTLIGVLAKDQFSLSFTLGTGGIASPEASKVPYLVSYSPVLTGTCLKNYRLASYSSVYVFIDTPLLFTKGTYTFQKVYDGKTENLVNLPSACYVMTTKSGTVLTMLTDNENVPLPTLQGTVTYSATDVSDCTASLTFTVDLTGSCYAFEGEGKQKTFTFDGYPAQITVKEVTLSCVEAPPRPYDGTTDITLEGGTLIGVLPKDKDNLLCSLGTGTVASPDVSGTAYPVSYTPVLSGSASKNYLLASYASVTALITKATPVVTPIFETSIFVEDASASLPAIKPQEGCVKGTLTWDAYSLAVLPDGEHDFGWTFVPEDTQNYLTAKGTGTVRIEALLVTDLTVSARGFRKFYVRDTFVPYFEEGGELLNVTAIYNNGTKKALHPDDYSCTLVSGNETFSHYTDNAVLISYTQNAVGGGTRTVRATYHATVSRKEYKTPYVISDFTYNGTLQLPLLSSFDDNEMQIKEGSQTSAVEAGSYTITIQLKDSNYAVWQNGQNEIALAWEIKKAVVLVPMFSKSQLTYNGNPQTVSLHKDYSSSNLFYIEEYSEFTATDVGRYAAVLTLSDTANYRWETTQDKIVIITWQIVPKRVSTPIVYNHTEYVYSGEPVVIEVESSPDYTVSGDMQRTNVGSYSVTATLNNDTYRNLVWTDGTTEPYVFTYNILIRTVSIPVCAVRTFPYSGNFVSLNIAESQDYSVTGDTVKRDSGSYKTVLSLYDKNNCKWADNTIANIEYRWSIQPVSVDKPALLQNNVYTGSEQTANILGNNEYYTLTGNKGTKAGTYYAVATLKNTTANNYVWADSSFSPLRIVWTIEPCTVQKPSQPENLLYNGLYQTVILETNSAYTVTGNSGKEAGSYQATVSLRNEEDYQWEDGTTSPLTIHWKICALLLDFGEENTEIDTSYSMGTLLASPYKNGYTFVGWYTSPDFSEDTKVSQIDEVTENTVLYAKWEESFFPNVEPTQSSILSTTAIIGISVLGGVIVLCGGSVLLFMFLRKFGRKPKSGMWG